MTARRLIHLRRGCCAKARRTVTLRSGQRPVIDAGVAVASYRGHLALAVAIAAELDHPAYDAVYLSVAEASELRFVTADDRLIRKIREGQNRFRHMLVALSEIG